MTATTQLAVARLTLNETQCEVLFASVLQPSDAPTADMVVETINRTVQQFGLSGQLGMMGPAKAQTTQRKSAVLAAAQSETTGSFGPVKQINAGVLNVGYVEVGPADGRPVILLHGFPYDIHSYVEVAPLLAAEGYRLIVPYFRGHGTTTFLSRTTTRNVDQAAFALDVLALMDALGIEKAILAGYDWGTRTADVIAALWPERVKALVSVSGYIITNLAEAKLKCCRPDSPGLSGIGFTSPRKRAWSASWLTGTT
jgi:hypothetical protein